VSQHDEVRFGSARPRRPWLLPGAAGAVAALAAALLVTHLLTTHPRHHIRARPLSATTELRPHLLGVTAAWQLVTYGPAGVIRIEPRGSSRPAGRSRRCSTWPPGGSAWT
jgi:hypothetical protein